MVQSINLTPVDSSTEYTLNSTTDSETITLSDDYFALIIAIEKLTKAINDLATTTRIKKSG